MYLNCIQTFSTVRFVTKSILHTLLLFGVILIGAVCSIATNGKRLCEVREFEELEVQEFRNEANAFSDCLN